MTMDADAYKVESIRLLARQVELLEQIESNTRRRAYTPRAECAGESGGQPSAANPCWSCPMRARGCAMGVVECSARVEWLNAGGNPKDGPKRSGAGRKPEGRTQMPADSGARQLMQP